MNNVLFQPHKQRRNALLLAQKKQGDDSYDISMAPLGTQIAADILFNTIRDLSNQAHITKSKNERDQLNKSIEKLMKSNQHLVPYYDSWLKNPDFNQQGYK